MIEPGEVVEVATQAPAARRAPAQGERRRPDQQETQHQNLWADSVQQHDWKISELRGGGAGHQKS